MYIKQTQMPDGASSHDKAITELRRQFFGLTRRSLTWLTFETELLATLSRARDTGADDSGSRLVLRKNKEGEKRGGGGGKEKTRRGLLQWIDHQGQKKGEMLYLVETGKKETRSDVYMYVSYTSLSKAENVCGRGVGRGRTRGRARE